MRLILEDNMKYYNFYYGNKVALIIAETETKAKTWFKRMFHCKFDRFEEVYV